MSFDFKLPDLGEGIREAEILSVKIKEGQAVAEDQPLFEVETDKAVVEIPSPVAGKVLKINVKNGEIVTVGSTMISIEESSSSKTKPAPKFDQKEDSSKDTASIQGAKSDAVKQADSQSEMPAIATPATRQLARELKVDLHLVKGSGPGGRISKEDVIAYSESLKGTKENKTSPTIGIKSGAKSESLNLSDFSKFGEIERVPVRSLRRRTAQLMSLSWSKIPHVTHSDEADVTELENFRKKYSEIIKKQDTKLTMTAFIMKAVAIALQKYPEFNTTLDEQAEEIIFKRYYNIGMAVATDRGLIVPVIQAVDKKTILELARDISQTAEKARAAKIELHELQGATFTITNIGSIGGTFATPIIHHPEAAILAVMKAKEKVIIRHGRIENGLIMPLCMAFDHRITDGAQAAYFIHTIVKMLEEPSSFEQYMGV